MDVLWLDKFLLALLSIVALTRGFDDHVHPEESTDCPLVQGEHHPPTKFSCDGKSRSTERVWDTRTFYNMTAREAFAIIEKIQEKKGDCSKAVIEGDKLIPLLNIRFESSGFRSIAEVAIRTANMMSDLLTRGACAGNLQNSTFFDDPTAWLNDDFLFSIVHSNIQNHAKMFGSGIWFLKNKYKNRTYFAPYAYKKREDGYLRAKDLSTTWGRAHTGFLPYIASIARNRTFLCRSSYLTPRKNQTTDEVTRHVTHPVAEYIDGLWGRPYFECSTTRAWIVGFFVPFFTVTYDNQTDSHLEVMGVATVDIDLSQVDINQCDLDGTSSFTYKIFAGTHHCHNQTSKCIHVPNRGFIVGSYKCVCRDGYYHPDPTTKYFDGAYVEQVFSNGTLNAIPDMFACKRCREGCITCVTDKPCIVETDYHMRYSILGVNLGSVFMCFGITVFIWRCREIQVVKSASPLFLLITLFGAVLMYTEAIILFLDPTDDICTAAPWFQHIGFALMYGSLLLKTWRVSLIFKIRNAKRVKIEDSGLLKRLIPMLLTYIVLLVIWTVAASPTSKTYYTTDKLQFQTCSENWWNHAMLILDILLLFWGILLCYTVRKAPTKFNESKYISLSIYNMTVFTIIIKLLKTFLLTDIDPDITYLLDCVRIQLTVSVLVILVFGPKIIRTMKGRGNQAETSKSRSIGGGSSDGTMHMVHENETLKAEITRLYSQLETMKQAKMDAGNRPIHRADSLASGINSASPSTPRGQSGAFGSQTTMKSTASSMRTGGNRYFSPAAELISDFV